MANPHARKLSSAIFRERSKDNGRLAILYSSSIPAPKNTWGNCFAKAESGLRQPCSVFDHDFPSWASGVVTPHGICDSALNLGHIKPGLSHFTSEFACDSSCWFWKCIGQQLQPHATEILILCDAGGSNSAHKYLFKRQLSLPGNVV